MIDASLVERTALGYLGAPYRAGFKCLDFVREVYAQAGFTVPPVELNVPAGELADPPPGFVLYLRHKQASRSRRWTHAVIILSGRRCIHCSYYFGRKVVVTPIDDLLALYEVA